MSGTAREVPVRVAGPDEAPALAALVVAGFEGYRAFAPDWSPPRGVAEEAAELRVRLEQEETWSTIAELDDEPVGFTLCFPGRRSRDRHPDTGLAQLHSLFVAPAQHGSGLGTRLLAGAVDAAGARGYARMRLFTPAGHARARRFYAREGWAPAGPPEHDPFFGLALVEYRRTLP